MVDRRSVLASGVALPLALKTSPLLARGAGSLRPLAIADITVRKDLQADFAGTIRKLRGMGYTHFGSRLRRYLPSEPPELAAAEKARILAAAGMKIGAVRLTTGFGSTNPADSLDSQIADAKVLGAHVIVVPAAHIFIEISSSGFRARVPSVHDVKAYGDELNTLGAQMARHGLKLAYHNHSFDAVKVGGQRALDLIIAETDPALVHFELDLAWAHVAGVDPLALARSLGPRLVSLHIKDYDPRHGANDIARMVTPGDGELGYATLLPELAAMTDALFAVEVDAPADGLRAAQRAETFVRAALNRQHSRQSPA